MEHSSDADRSLRFRLWSEIRSRLELGPSLPLSTSFENARATAVAVKAAEHYKPEGVRSSQPSEPDFSEVVRAEIKLAVFSALEGEDLAEEERRKAAAEFLQKLQELPQELRDSSLEQAVQSGNWAVAASLFSAGSLAGLGAAVEVFGFSAFILAVKA